MGVENKLTLITEIYGTVFGLDQQNERRVFGGETPSDCALKLNEQIDLMGKGGAQAMYIGVSHIWVLNNSDTQNEIASPITSCTRTLRLLKLVPFDHS